MTKEQYVQGKRDIVYIIDRFNKAIELKQVMDFVGSDDPDTKYQIPGEEAIDYLPTKNYKLTIDKQSVLANKTINIEDSSLIVNEILWSIKKNYIQKNEMIILDILANNNWKRPIYFVTPYGDSDIGLSEYLQLDGFVYRLVPIKTKPKDFLSVGRIDPSKLYNKFMEAFRWGRMNEPDVTIDHNNQRTTTVLRLRNNFNRLALELMQQNKKDSAITVLDKIIDLMPQEKYPFDYFMIGISETYYKLNENEKANKIVKDYFQVTNENLRYLFSLSRNFDSAVDYEKQVNIQVLQELGSLVERYNQPDLKNEIDGSLKDYMGRYYQNAYPK